MVGATVPRPGSSFCVTELRLGLVTPYPRRSAPWVDGETTQGYRSVHAGRAYRCGQVRFHVAHRTVARLPSKPSAITAAGRRELVARTRPFPRGFTVSAAYPPHLYRHLYRYLYQHLYQHLHRRIDRRVYRHFYGHFYRGFYRGFYRRIAGPIQGAGLASARWR